MAIPDRRGPGNTDPRPARSRARLIDAATALLRAGGPSAVTIDAVTRSANVARATLYRHFSSANDLMARGLHGPAATRADAAGRRILRDQLIAVVEGWAETIAEVPACSPP